MRVTFRLKLLVVLTVSVAGVGLIIVLERAITSRAARQLEAIERKYVPLVELRPELESSLDALGRAFQDAVATQDEAALTAAAEVRHTFLSKLDAAGDALDPATADELRKALDAYYVAAQEVSKRLIAGDSGLNAVAAMSDMQEKLSVVRTLVLKVAELNRGTLTAAFELVRTALYEAERWRTLVGLSTLAVILLMSVALSREMMHSLVILKSGLTEFGTGRFTRRIGVPRNDEFGDVARSANQMADQIQGLLENLSKKSAELAEANRLLAVSNTELEAFSYSVSHDLRAPLRAIDGFSKALLTEYAGAIDERGRHYLERVRAGSQRMSRLIDDLLNLSRITRSAMRDEVVNFSATAHAIVDELRGRDPRRMVEIEIEEGMRVHGDARLIAILLSNLIGNAWKFTGKTPDARIGVGQTLRDGAQVFFVTDNGAGFDPAHADKLFHPFQRLHAESEFEGTGIGLATVQRIVRRHGGTIWAEGRPGQGATFFFTLGRGDVETTERLTG